MALPHMRCVGGDRAVPRRSGALLGMDAGGVLISGSWRCGRTAAAIAMAIGGPPVQGSAGDLGGAPVRNRNLVGLFIGYLLGFHFVSETGGGVPSGIPDQLDFMA